MRFSPRAARAIAVFAFLGYAPSPVRAQQMAAETTDYLVRVTQRWGASSPIGELRANPMGADDIELRVWGGYGLGGTRGVILRRRSDRWQAWRARVVTCVFEASMIPGIVSSSRRDSLLVATMRRGCPRRASGGGTFYSVDTLALEVADARNAERVWDRALRAGVFELPAKLHTDRITVDGFGIVIEVRRGDVYRASRFAATSPPELSADSAAREIYRTVAREFGRSGERDR